MGSNLVNGVGRTVAAFVLTIVSAGCTTGEARADELDLIAERLELRAGMNVADVGAGDGEWSVELARIVGETGHIWATEVNVDDVSKIEERIEEGSFSNMTAVLGTGTSTGLPAECCDALLLRLVYHHFVEPEPMRASLWESLRPGGLLVAIEIRPKNSWPEVEDVPDRGGHGIDPAELKAELEAAGFEFVQQFDKWNGDRLRYCSVFRRSDER